MTADARTADNRITFLGAAVHLAQVALTAPPETVAAIDVVMNRLDELMTAADTAGLTAFPDEWGVRFVDEDGNTEGPDAGDEYATREPAEQIVRKYVDARLVKRTSFRGPWTLVTA